MECRICYEGGELIAPCRCSGSRGFVHRKCLDEWRSQSRQTFYKCEICEYEYKFVSSVSSCSVCWYHTEFILKVIAEITLVIILFLCFVAVNTLATMVYMQNYICMDTFKETIPLGFFVSFAMLGGIACIYLIVSDNDDICLPRSRRRGNNHDSCCTVVCVDNSSDCCSCPSHRSNSSSSSELMMLLFIFFALIGIVFVLAYATGRVSTRVKEHWENAYYFSLSRRYIVEDLNSRSIFNPRVAPVDIEDGIRDRVPLHHTQLNHLKK